MFTLPDKFERSQDFLIGVELVSTRGTVLETRAAKTVAFARDLATAPGVDWVSITDNAGGNPMLAAPALGGPFRDAGREAVIHLSCKDFNRNALESEAWHLASEGFHNLLVLTGDYSGPGIGGGAKPVFDIDSVGLLTLLGRLNAGLDVTRAAGRPPTRLDPTRFFAGAVVTNFKLHENEVMPQLYKMERKLAAGARFLINQIGYDARKIHELRAWMERRGHGAVPLIGNVYVLNPAVARVFRTQRIPGVVISDELAALCERHAASPDKGKAFFLELAARQLAIYRGLGYRGAYLGGVHTAAEIQRVLAIARDFAPDDWQQFARELRFSRPGEFFVFPEDPATGLADPTRLNPAFEASLRARPASPNVTYSYRFSKFAHGLMFTPGQGLWNLGVKLSAGAKDPKQGPAWLRAIERTSKRLMFDCRDCGDCSLPEIAFLCPESACAKNQRNGPCGGTRDGLCEVADYECIWSRAYDRLKSEGRSEELLAHVPVMQDQSLRDTSSWANTWLGRDHLAKKNSAPLPSQSPPVTGVTPSFMNPSKPTSLEAKLQQYANPVDMLRHSTVGGIQFPIKPEYSNWRDEQSAWQDSVILFDQSFHMKDVYVEGPDVKRLISDVAVNSMANFGANRAKQIVACNHDGRVIGDAILFGLADDKYSVVGRPSVPNWVEFNARTGNYDVKVTVDEWAIYNKDRRLLYRYQIQGPRALDLIRSVHEGVFPDIKFFHLGELKIAGHKVRALGHNMSRMGGLELHGPLAEGKAVLDAILAAGPKFGLVQGGARSYATVSPESGWIPSPMPAIYAGEKMKPYREWLPADGFEATASLGGSYVSDRIEDYYQTPWDLGYGRHVKFDHDFIGRAALEKIAGQPHRRKVWLRWNNDDVLKVYASQLRPGDRYKYMEMPNAYYSLLPFDRVMAGGRMVGLSTYTIYTANVRGWFSLAMVDADLADGAEVAVVWGEENGGSPRPIVERHVQTEVRATVSDQRLNLPHE